MVTLAQQNNTYTANNYNNEVEEFTQTTVVRSRDLIGYNLYRDGALIAEFGSDVFSYVDNDTEHDTVYCYTVKSVYEDGLSIPSNESCDEWILMPATDFVATGTNGQVELAWNAAQENDVLNYNIYRDGGLLANTSDTFYYDITAEHNVEYCYSIAAVYDLGESALTDEECAMWEILSPGDLTADGLDGHVHLEWTDPPDGGGGGIGDECVSYDYYGNYYGLGYVDCIGFCFPEVYLVWVGDGFCDDGTYGIVFTCTEWDCDGCDCAGTGTNPQECIDECGSFSNDEDVDPQSFYRSENNLGDLPEANNNNEPSRDLIAFNIYRYDAFLTSVDAGVYEYDDYDVENLETYCYTVTSV